MSNILISEKFFKMIIFLSRFFVATFLFFCFAQTTFAQVEITEIMYDLEGSDKDKEWIEIYNAGNESIDISSWKFFEADTNHGLTILYGDGMLGVGEYALIISKENPDFFGDVFDSTFSLSNTGEKLIIRNADLNDIDSVVYSSEWGANGDGNSLQKVNGSWCAGVPTPGAVNAATCGMNSSDPPSGGVDDSPDNGSDEQDYQEPPDTYSDTMPEWAVEPKITAYAGERKRVVVAGAHVDFTGQARGADGELLQYARYVWSLGDGSREDGKDIIHTYYYPGEYIVVLDAASGGYAAMDRISVEVISADIVISNVSFDELSFVEIHNKTSYELDLSQWQIQTGKQKFAISKHTFIRSGKKLVFSSQITGLCIKKGDEVDLLYPNGDVAVSFDASKDITKTKEANKNLNDTTPKIQTASDQIEETPVINNAAHKDPSPSSSSLSLPEEQVVLGHIAMAQNTEGEETVISNIGNVAQAQVANVINSANKQQKTKKTESGLFWGLIGVSLLSLVAVYTVLESKDRGICTGAKSEAASYKIIEIKD